ncbi:MAG: polysaccharide deacetylase family protein, partial [Fusobacteriaceae bacterium]|nr:polysaccharide deacetylase family protein [Fusobacteriaceae bacterium]
MNSSELTIIMYHYVRNLKDSRFPEIKGLDISLFEEQIKYLIKHYNIVSIDQVIENLDNKKCLPNNPVILTFDDGYKDHYTYVFPILIKYNIKGCFYIPAKCFKEKKVLDVNKIHFILASEEDKRKIIKDIFELLDKNREKYFLEQNTYYYKKLAIKSRFDTEDVIFIKRILQVELIEELRSNIIDYLFKKYVTNDETAFWEELYLTKDQIQCMQKLGMHIGSHSYDHIWLGSVDGNIQDREIQNSLKFMKEIGIKTDNWTMCYPYGSYNEATIEILKENKCKLALTTEVKIANLTEGNRYILPRFDTNDIPK